jgi:hypothetical protein
VPRENRRTASCICERDDRFLFSVTDLNDGRGVLGDRARLGDDDGDRIADIVNLAVGHRRHTGPLHLFDRVAAHQLNAERREVLRGVNRPYTCKLARRRCVY